MEKKKQGTTGKGNHGNHNTANIQELNTANAERVQALKRFAEARRQAVTYKQEAVADVLERIADYFKKQEAEDKPFTISGVQLAIGCSNETFYRMKSGDYDNRLFEYIDNKGIDANLIGQTIQDDVTGEAVPLIPWSQVIQKALQRVEEQTETRLYTNGRVGDIFALKAKHGWSDEGNQPRQVYNNLIIQDTKQAEEFIKMLGSK